MQQTDEHIQEERIARAKHSKQAVGQDGAEERAAQANGQTETCAEGTEGRSAKAANSTATTGAASRARTPRSPRKRSRVPRVLAIVLGALIVVALAAGGIYYKIIHDNIRYDGDLKALMACLTDADYSKPFYALVVCSDTKDSAGTRSDVMCLARIDLTVPQVTLVTVPRDTTYHFNDGSTYKINEVYNREGVTGTIKAVEDVTGVKISHYFELDTAAVGEVVDSLGGVEVNVPYALSYYSKKNGCTMYLQTGTQTVDGEAAVVFAAHRASYDNYLGEDFTSDAVRQYNVRTLLKAVLAKTLDAGVLELPGRVADLTTMVSTDTSLTTLTDWALRVANRDQLIIYSVTGPYEGEIFSYNGGTFLSYEDPEAWSQLMEAVNSGVDPATVLERKTTADGKVANSQDPVIIYIRH